MSKYTLLFKTGVGNLFPRSFSFDIEEQQLFKYANVTCRFFEEHADFIPAKFTDIVLIYENYGKSTEKKLFEGYIQDVPRKREGKIVEYEYELVSKWTRAQHLIVYDVYQESTASDMFRSLINKHAADTGITLGVVDDSTHIFSKYRFQDMPLSECIQQLMDISGFYVNVDEDARTIDFTRYTQTKSYYGLFEDNVVRGTASFTESVGSMVNTLHIYGEGQRKTLVEDADSISKYGIRADVTRYDYIHEFADLAEIGNKQLEKYANPIKIGGCQVIDPKDWKANNLVEVHLPKLNINSEWIRISSIRREYSPGSYGLTTTISFNEEPTLHDTMAQTISKIKELERGMSNVSEDDIKDIINQMMTDTDFKSKYDLTQEQLMKLINDALLQKPIPKQPFTDTGQPGSGTINDPYYIRTAEDLAGINPNLNVYYRQVYDIDLAQYQEETNSGLGWIAIGTVEQPFIGKYDGNNCIITGLRIERPEQDYLGLFGVMGQNAYIQNVHMRDAYVVGRDYVGLLCGMVSDNDTGTIIGKSGVTGRVEGRNYVGPLTGFANSSTRERDILIQCYANAGVEGYQYVGGLAGAVAGGVRQAFSASEVEGYKTVGGLVTGICTLHDCFFKGTIRSKDIQNEFYSTFGLLSSGNSNVYTSYSSGMSYDGLGAAVFTTGGVYQNQTSTYYDYSLFDPNHTPYDKNDIMQSTNNMMNMELYTHDDGTPSYDFTNIWILGQTPDYPQLRWYTLLTTPETTPEEVTTEETTTT